MKLALAQLNPTVGDLVGNRRLVEDAARRAARAGAELALFPELALCGYPPLDLLERDDFVRAQLRELEALKALSAELAPLVLALGVALPVAREGARPDGQPQRDVSARAREGARSGSGARPCGQPQRDASARAREGGKRLQNAGVLLQGGAQIAAQAKTLLPTYDVFDENRYFIPGQERAPHALKTRAKPVLGLSICEDAWARELGYGEEPIAELARGGATLLANLSASPFSHGRARERRQLFGELAARHGVPFAFVNQVGGNDELIFDGGSCVLGARGEVLAALPLFEPALEIVNLKDAPAPARKAALESAFEMDAPAQTSAALTLGIRDYFRKLGLPPRVVVGLSGGIDSAVTAWLAQRALGADNVLGVAMPGPFSSAHSLADALELGARLGIEVRRADIRPLYDAYLRLFAELFGAREDYGLAQQNIQSRIRGALLMAISNAEDRLVLATGNKSELSIGYCTLYGDTVGGLAVLGDVYKTEVYALARFANRERAVIPERSIEKPPSAELAPGQLDSDDLPAYDVLDAVLRQAIEGGRGQGEIVKPAGVSLEAAKNIVRRLDRNEYKRRQAPLVLRVSKKAFGSGRRLPIVRRA